MRRIIIIALLMLLTAVRTFTQTVQLSDVEKGYLKKAYRYDKNGWTFVHIEGAPYERGFQRGYLTAVEIADFRSAVAHSEWYEYAREWQFWVRAADSLFKNKVSEEYVREMQGIADGASRAGKNMSYEDILFLNGLEDVLWYWWPIQKEQADKVPKQAGGCSAFIANGKMTADGRIVLAHNTWTGYQFAKGLIVDLVPEHGHRILMQSYGPSLYSVSDFFITDAGLVGAETTIGGFEGYDSAGLPVFERARRAMQYAGTIDEWAKILVDSNNGAYANSWLLGDLNTNEIARLELGLKHHSLERTADGYFTGSNITTNIELLRDETSALIDDIRTGPVARRVRWNQLMKQYAGRIDAETAKKLLADHYDCYLESETPDLRTICGHGESDNGYFPAFPGTVPYGPAGAIDGKVVTSELAGSMRFWAKWGHPCDIEFNAKEFLERHPQFDYLGGYLPDLKSNPWTEFPGVTEK